MYGDGEEASAGDGEEVAGEGNEVPHHAVKNASSRNELQ